MRPRTGSGERNGRALAPTGLCAGLTRQAAGALTGVPGQRRGRGRAARRGLPLARHTLGEDGPHDIIGLRLDVSIDAGRDHDGLVSESARHNEERHPICE